MRPDLDGRTSGRSTRRSLRLKGYDYSWTGAYFVTVVVQGRLCLFGNIVDGVMHLNDAGRMIRDQWLSLWGRFTGVLLDAFVVMPNHVHGIVVLMGAGLVPARHGAPSGRRAPTRGAPTGSDDDPHRECFDVGAGLVPARRGAPTRGAPTVGDIVGAFKSMTTVEYIRGIEQSHWPAFNRRLWQRNYYEHIIRSDESLSCIREYITNNPRQWEMDRENPNVARTHGRTGGKPSGETCASPSAKDEPWRV